MTVIDMRPVEADAQHKEQQLRRHQVLGELIAAVPADIRISDWSIAHRGIDALTGGSAMSDDERREMLRRIAEVFGLEYDEKDHGGGRNIVTASGFVGGVHVRFWRLVSPCHCNCGKAAAA